MDTTSEPNRGDVRTSAAASLTPDAATAALLAKHAAYKQGEGPPPTQSEFGKLGAWIKKKFTAGDSKPADATGPATSPPEASSPGDDAEPIDAGLVQRTTSAVLARVESIARRYVGDAARKAGAQGETLARLERAAALPRDDRALMVELSPEVAASLGVNPRHYPVAVFVGCLGLWGTDLFLAVQELKQLQAQRSATPAAATPDPEGRLLTVKRPPGAPTDVQAK